MTETTIFDFLAAELSDAETQWSLGTFGAVAEFMRDADEPAVLGRSETALSAVTGRGGIRLAPRADMQLVNGKSSACDRSRQPVALCLPRDAAAMTRRAVLTELGPDAHALRDADREGVLFDLGLDTMQVDCCVRICDPDTLTTLRACAGRAIFDPANPAMRIILAADPHRVFISRLGRIEVFQPIPPPDGTSPEGPHTHVLPGLLQQRRTHAASESIPDGWIPCAHLYAHRRV